MRVLTVKQPWADLIMAGVKDVENRSWPVPSTLPQWWLNPPTGNRWPDEEVGEKAGLLTDGPFPFRLGIHAAKEPDRSVVPGSMAMETWLDVCWSGAETYDLGVLLGFVTVTGCHHADDCTYSPGDPLGNFADPPCSQWAQPDVFHWELADPEPLAVPVPMTGRLGLWTTDLANTK